MTVSEQLDGAFSLYRATAGTVAVIVLVVLAPLELLSAIVLATLAPMAAPGGQLSQLFGGGDVVLGPAQAEEMLAGLAVIVPTALVGAIAGLFASAAVTWAAAQHGIGEKVRWSDALRAAAARFWALLGAWLLVILATVALLVAVVAVAVALSLVTPWLGVPVGLLAALALFLLVLPVSYVIVPVVVLEGTGSATGLGRTIRLLRPRLGHVLLVVVLAAVIVAVLAAIAGAVVAVLAGAAGIVAAPLAWIVSAAGNVLVAMVTVPLIAALALVVYVDARVRHEGLDIEVLTASLPAR